MKITPDQIYTFKFNSGEEVITKVTSVDGDWIEISNPVAVAPGPQGMGLITASFTADHDLPMYININNCALVGQTDETIQSKYIQATTGIQVPEKKLVLG
jgi:hypothetical protein